jgi:hypothetical protein
LGKTDAAVAAYGGRSVSLPWTLGKSETGIDGPASVKNFPGVESADREGNFAFHKRKGSDIKWMIS